VDGQTLQITSREALVRIEPVEFYTVPQAVGSHFSTSAALVESLQKAVADQPNKADRPDDVRMRLDEPSGRLIVRGTPEVLRFLSERFRAGAK
jgi:hypothetical protein